MSVHFQAMFRHLGCPAALGGSSQKAINNNNEIFFSFSPNAKAKGDLESLCETFL